MIDVYNLDDVKKFWEVIQPDDNGFVEIRLTPIINTSNVFWNHCKTLSKLLPTTPVNKMVCFFIKTYDELEQIITYNNGYFNINSKICYALNLRYITKDGVLNGTYDCVKNIRFIAFDIDNKEKITLIQGTTQEIFDDYVLKVVKFMERYGLYNPILINSGGGKHCIFIINKVKVTSGRRLWYKEFIEEIKLFCSNNEFVVDPLIDFTRIFSLPGSFHPKREVLVSIDRFSKHINNDFVMKSKKVPKINEEKILVYKKSALPNIKDSLEFQILLHIPPKGERHQIVLFSLRLLLKEKGCDYLPYEAVLRKIYGGGLCLNPKVGTQNKTYSKGIIINYAKRNWEWVEKYPKLVEIYKQYIQV